jgi:hypothetical protein
MTPNPTPTADVSKPVNVSITINKETRDIEKVMVGGWQLYSSDRNKVDHWYNIERGPSGQQECVVANERLNKEVEAQDWWLISRRICEAEAAGKWLCEGCECEASNYDNLPHAMYVVSRFAKPQVPEQVEDRLPGVVQRARVFTVCVRCTLVMLHITRYMEFTLD